MTSTSASWSPAFSPRPHSFDSIASHRPQPPALPPTSDIQRRADSSPSSSSARVPSPLPQPQALLNMNVIQAHAELLEMQTRRDREEVQRQAEQHFEEMLESKGFRVTHACEHCRQRKAKCSGQQPCQRCAKQGILCVYSKQDRRGRMFGPVQPFDVPSQSSSRWPAGMLPSAPAAVGPMRAEKQRELRFAGMSMPYGLRRNTAPSMVEYGLTVRDVPLPSGTSGALPPVASGSAVPLLPPTTRELRAVGMYYGGPSQSAPQQLLRPTPLRFSSSYDVEERRDSGATVATAGSMEYQGPQVQPDSPYIERPWTMDSAPYPSTAHYPAGEELQPKYNSLPSRSSEAPSGLVRLASASSTGGMWTEGALPATSSTFNSRGAFQPSLHRTAALDDHQSMMEVDDAQESARHGSWSADSSRSQTVGHGGLPTEDGRPHTGDPLRLESRMHNASTVQQLVEPTGHSRLAIDSFSEARPLSGVDDSF